MRLPPTESLTLVSRPIVTKRHRGIGIRRASAAVQGVVAKGGGLVLPIGERRQIAVEVVLIALCAAQRIRPRLQPVHLVIRVGRRLVLRIRDGEQIAVVVIAEAGEAAHGILNLRHPIEVVIAEAALGAPRIGEEDQPGDRIVGAGGDVREGIGRGGEIALRVVGKARHVSQRIGDARGLPGRRVLHHGLFGFRIGDGGRARTSL